MSITAWDCEGCGASGRLRHPKHEDVFSVIYAIRKQHAALAPDECRYDPDKIRVSRLTKTKKMKDE